MLMPNDQPKKKHSVVLKILIGIGVLLASVWVVNTLTPLPFSFVFKTYMDQKQDVVELGPYESWIANISESDPIPIKTEKAPDPTLTLYRSNTHDKQKLIFFIHGGGWIVGSSQQLSDYAKLMASYGYTVASLDYSLAPKDQYPTPIYQSLAALEYLNEHQETLNIDMTHYLLSGNSAGAQIAAQLGSIMSQDQTAFQTTLNKDNLKGLLLINGVYNFDTVEAMRFPGFKMFAWSYTGQKDYWNFERIDELSVMYAVDSNYPPTFLTVGDSDPLEAQSYAFDAVLRKNNVRVEDVYWTGSKQNLYHDFIFDLNKPASQETFQKMMRFAEQVMDDSVNSEGGE